MGDYIKREDAKRAIRRNFHDFETRLMINNIINEVAKVSSDNLIEVVRCKDCRFYEIYPNGANGDCINQIDAFNTFYPNDFCSYGERADT